MCYTFVMDSVDEHFMARALELAQLGRGLVEPNPMVGAVIVRPGEPGPEIIAEGFHAVFGGPHAEVQAMRAARQACRDVRGSTMYVTLEPCSHFGKTPPCADAIIAAGISRVVVAMLDPDEKVAGRGLKKLRQAGLTVDVGVCQAQARQLLGPYIKLRTQAKPWVICKWAQTADGAIALPSDAGRWISSEASREQVHKLRSYCDGVLVGTGTAQADDPLLTDRSGQAGPAARQLARVVLDSKLALPPESQLVRTANDSPVIVATTAQAIQDNPAKVRELDQAGVELLALPTSQAGLNINALLVELGRRQWTYLLVEGGSKVLNSFIASGQGDELWAFVSPAKLSSAELVQQPRFDLADVIAQGQYVEINSQTIGPDTLHKLRRVIDVGSAIADQGIPNTIS